MCFDGLVNRSGTFRFSGAAPEFRPAFGHEPNPPQGQGLPTGTWGRRIEVLQRHSKDASVVLLGFNVLQEDEARDFQQYFGEITSDLPTVLLVCSSGEVDLFALIGTGSCRSPKGGVRKALEQEGPSPYDQGRVLTSFSGPGIWVDSLTVWDNNEFTSRSIIA